MELLAYILQPVVRLLRFVLESLYPLTGSYGLAIMMLSALVSVILSPVTGLARRLEDADRRRQQEMAPLLDEVRRSYTGRERFEKTDEIYQRFSYHPIKSMGSLLPLFVQLPFLIAALLLLVDYPPIKGVGFLMLPSLSAPDELLPFGIHLLPVLLTGVALLESQLRPESTPQSRQRFWIVALVLLVLIYPFPAGVCLYWLTSNMLSLGRSVLRRFSAPR